MGIWERFSEKIRGEGETETYTCSRVLVLSLSLGYKFERIRGERKKGLKSEAMSYDMALH